MKLVFDTKILKHKHFTGVENYTKAILEQLLHTLQINQASPRVNNKYLVIIWTHLILPFKQGDILFCPVNIAPIFVPSHKKLVLTLHDVAFITQPKSYSTFFRLYYKLILPINLKRANKIITVSQSSKREIVKYYKNVEEKIEVIYLGVDAMFKPLPIKKKKQMLYVGSFNERKNLVGVLQAYKFLDKSDYKLVIVGNIHSNFSLNDEMRRLLQEAESDRSIVFLKGVNNQELVELYNESEIFLFPSFYEGFGLPVLEAMACGTPVVCSDTTSLSEVGGDAVVYCDPYDVNDIKDKVKMLIDAKTQQQTMIKKGLQRARIFTWEKTAQEHVRVFQKALEDEK